MVIYYLVLLRRELRSRGSPFSLLSREPRSYQRLNQHSQAIVLKCVDATSNYLQGVSLFVACQLPAFPRCPGPFPRCTAEAIMVLNALHGEGLPAAVRWPGLRHRWRTATGETFQSDMGQFL